MTSLLAIPSPVLPSDEFLRAWQDDPLGSTPLVWADYLEERCNPVGRLLRELAAAWRQTWRQMRRAPVPSDWDAAIAELPLEWCSVFAVGCAARCILWAPVEYRQEQMVDLAGLIGDLATDPWSEAAMVRSEAAWSRSAAALASSKTALARETKWQAHWLAALLSVLGTEGGAHD